MRTKPFRILFFRNCLKPITTVSDIRIRLFIIPSGVSVFMNIVDRVSSYVFCT